MATIKTVAFTGHRPQAFRDEETTTWVQEQLKQAVQRAILNGVNWFISGGALGVDQWAISAILMQSLGDIRLTVARPFPSQSAVWTLDQQMNYQNMLEHANEVVDVNPDPYAGWKYIERDKWMVDRADAVIAVYDGREKGGTATTFQYARKKGRPILWINPLMRDEKWIRQGGLGL